MTDLDPCACDDYAVSRRSLLKAAGLASMAGVTTSMFGDVLTQTVYGATNANVLVVVSLRGGADGLSMVVPYNDEAYRLARPRTLVAADKVLHGDGTFGLHPKFAPLSDLWEARSMAAIHAVGLPTPNRSHFDAMEAVEDADPGSSARIGWLNRLVSGLSSAPDVFDGIQVGSTVAPTSLVGPAPSLATSEFDDLAGPFGSDAALRKRVLDGLGRQYAKRGGTVGAAAANAFVLATRAASISDSVAESPPGVVYPQYSELGQALKTTAGLIRAGVGVKAVAVDAGGWDHHVDMSWRMNNQVGDLATCLAMFFKDLGTAADRVTVVTISEFGRRLQENGSQGVDHGYGNAMFALGAGVRGRDYYARWPGLGSAQQIDGDLAVTTDYRSVLAEILRSRFPAVDTSKVFPGLTDAPLGFMT